MNRLIRDLLKIARELLSYHLGDEGWLLPDRTYLEVKMFQGHTQIVIDWYMWKHLKIKGAIANETFSVLSQDIKEWKKAGLPVSDFPYFSPMNYNPNQFALESGWIRINDGGFELPNPRALSLVQEFLMSKVGNTSERKAKIYVDVFRGHYYLTNFEEILAANSINNLTRG